jgi:FKBP-type peptidyl-prolyl cis-trans isomerase FkpA
MKKLVPLLFALIILFSQCNKKDTCPNPTTTAPESEVTALETYLTTNNITATKDSRGFYYSISSPGGSSKPDNCATVSVKYKGLLTSGTVFDQSTTAVSFPLANLITGWQEGIPLIGITGKIRLYLPPSLGYGSKGSTGIPANSILIFDVELIGF